VSFAAGDSMNLPRLLAAMEQADQAVTTGRFSFTQDVVYTLTGEKQRTSGTVAFKKPASVSLSQQEPVEQHIISDGKKVWIYTPSYKQVVQDTWKKWTANSMVPDTLFNFGQNLPELRGKYHFSYRGQDGDFYLLHLAPKAPEQWSITLWVSTATCMPVRVRMEGENIALVTEAKNVEINPSLDRTLFTFTPPPGIDVITLP
jgi:outer membrane lipoprotein carrier protein